MSYKKGDIVELKINDLSPGGGRGVGKTEDGMVVFVSHVAPLEKVKVKLTKVKKKFAEAELIELIEASSMRRKAPCAYFGKCGGCQWQHIDYSEQINQKEKFLAHEFKRLGFNEKIEVVPSSHEFRYRNRIQIQQHGARLGFLKNKSHDIVEIEDCLIAEEDLIGKFSDIRKLKSKNRIEIVKDQEGKVHYYSKKRSPHLNLFSQVNTEQNKNLLDYLLTELNELKPQGVLDLYCGEGNITFPLLNQFPEAKIAGVELSESSIEKAKLQQTPINFIASDVLKFLKLADRPTDLVVLDPPRMGAGVEVCEDLLKLKAKTIVYVSCDLANLVRDLKVLLKSYSIESVKGFDMFPQTYHLETVVRLNRTNQR